jgi:hypothetical protein
LFESPLELLRASGAGQKSLTEVESVAAALAPFDGMDLTEFATLLVQAEEYRRTGILPVAAGKAPRKPAAPKAPAAPALGVAEAIMQIQQILDTAYKPEVTFESIAELVKRLDKCRKPDLDKICSHFQLPKPKTKKDALDAVKWKLEGMKGIHDRVDF